MTTVQQTRPFVVGVDTHAKTHTYAIVKTTSRQMLGRQQFPTIPKGVIRAIAWVGRLTGGDAAALWAIEGVATYGAKLARAAADGGYEVVEAPRMSLEARHGIGKSDPLDSHAIASAVLPLEEDRLRPPRADDGTRQALRVLVAARDQMAQDKTTNINALTALLRINELGIDARKPLTALLRVNELGIDARKPLTALQIGQASRWHNRAEPLAIATARDERYLA